MSVEKFLEIRAKRKAILKQLNAWGNRFQYLAMLSSEEYSRSQKGVDFDYPPPEVLRDTHTDYIALLREEIDLYKQLPESSQAEFKPPPPVLDY